MNIQTLFLAGLTLLGSACVHADDFTLSNDLRAGTRQPIVIAHRGASGYLPEHTLAAYTTAIYQGADFIEPDLVSTKDGELIARHDNVLNLTTDVAAHPEFADRKATKTIDGIAVTGWFSEDFTLAEIKTLRAIERIPDTRPANTRFDRQFEIPTLQEIIDLARAMKRVTGREIGLYPETKHPTYFASLGLSLEEPLVWTLHRNGYNNPRDKVFIQSFETANLKRLHRMTRIPLVQLFSATGQPYDVVARGGSLTYQDMATASGLRDIARYAQGVGPDKTMIIPLTAQGELNAENATNFVRDAHLAGLVVHPYTFRAENRFLPMNLRDGQDLNARGHADEEIKVFLKVGIDGFFTDYTDVGLKARAAP